MTNEREANDEDGLPLKGECVDQRGVVKGFGEVGRNQMGTSYKLAPAKRKEGVW